jgi:hypothetical protein
VEEARVPSRPPPNRLTDLNSPLPELLRAPEQLCKALIAVHDHLVPDHHAPGHASGLRKNSDGPVGCVVDDVHDAWRRHGLGTIAGVRTSQVSSIHLGRLSVVAGGFLEGTTARPDPIAQDAALLIPNDGSSPRMLV